MFDTPTMVVRIKNQTNTSELISKYIEYSAAVNEFKYN